MDVLDVLEDDVDRDVAKLDLGRHQYSVCALTMRKIRSTSASSCRDPIERRLDDLLAGLDAAPAVGANRLDRLVDLERQVQGRTGGCHVGLRVLPSGRGRAGPSAGRAQVVVERPLARAVSSASGVSLRRVRPRTCLRQLGDALEVLLVLDGLRLAERR